MNQEKIVFIIGTKAQLIKMAPIMRELQERRLVYDFIWTGQHKETIDEIIENFGIKKPSSKLYDGSEVKSPIKGIIWFTSLFLKGLFKTRRKRVNGVVLIHGDAVSAIIGLVYGRAAGYKIGHIEAGLRSFNFLRPFPEEIVRYVVSFFTDYHFAPGDWAAENLAKRKGKIINTKMNTLVDALMYVKKSGKKKTNEKYAVVNLHRFENIQNKKIFSDLLSLIIEISEKIKVIFIIHPTTKYQLDKFDLMERLKKAENITIQPRLSYIDFVSLFSKSEFLITDGGSNQEETSYLGHPCLLLRKETERMEGLGKGGNVLISSYSKEKIMDFTSNYTAYKRKPTFPKRSPSSLIVNFLQNEGFGIVVEKGNEVRRTT